MAVQNDASLSVRGFSSFISGRFLLSADCVSAIQDGWFVTGHDDGRLALWREEKKRPVGDVITAAHGYEGDSHGSKRSVMCCGGVAMSDVLATGSNDGHLRLWKVS